MPRPAPCPHLFVPRALIPAAVWLSLPLPLPVAAPPPRPTALLLGVIRADDNSFSAPPPPPSNFASRQIEVRYAAPRRRTAALSVFLRGARPPPRVGFCSCSWFVLRPAGEGLGGRLTFSSAFPHAPRPPLPFHLRTRALPSLSIPTPPHGRNALLFHQRQTSGVRLRVVRPAGRHRVQG